MRQLSRLRTLASKNDGECLNDNGHSNENSDGPKRPAVARRTPRGNAGAGGGEELHVPIPHPEKNMMRSTKHSLFREHKSEDDERGCMEAVAAFLAAIARAHAAAGKDDTSEEGPPPALLQTSSGSGMVNCRDSARELLHVFGHAPLVHLEGVIWIKTTGQRGDGGESG